MSDVVGKMSELLGGKASQAGGILSAIGGNPLGWLGAKGEKEEGASAPAAATVDAPTVTGENSVEAQSAQRRLARLSRYFTTPTGVMDAGTGSQGVF